MADHGFTDINRTQGGTQQYHAKDHYHGSRSNVYQNPSHQPNQPQQSNQPHQQSQPNQSHQRNQPQQPNPAHQRNRPNHPQQPNPAQQLNQSYQQNPAQQPHQPNQLQQPNQSYQQNEAHQPNQAHQLNQVHHPNKAQQPHQSHQPNQAHQRNQAHQPNQPNQAHQPTNDRGNRNYSKESQNNVYQNNVPAVNRPQHQNDPKIRYDNRSTNQQDQNRSAHVNNDNRQGHGKTTDMPPNYDEINKYDPKYANKLHNNQKQQHHYQTKSNDDNLPSHNQIQSNGYTNRDGRSSQDPLRDRNGSHYSSSANNTSVPSDGDKGKHDPFLNRSQAQNQDYYKNSNQQNTPSNEPKQMQSQTTHQTHASNRGYDNTKSNNEVVQERYHTPQPNNGSKNVDNNTIKTGNMGAGRVSDLSHITGHRDNADTSYSKNREGYENRAFQNDKGRREEVGGYENRAFQNDKDVRNKSQSGYHEKYDQTKTNQQPNLNNQSRNVEYRQGTQMSNSTSVSGMPPVAPQRNKHMHSSKTGMSNTDQRQYQSKQDLSNKDQRQYQSQSNVSNIDQRQYQSKPDVSNTDQRQYQSKPDVSNKDQRQYQSKQDLSNKDQRQYQSQSNVYNIDQRQYQSKPDVSNIDQRQYQSKLDVSNIDQRQYQSKPDVSNIDQRAYQSKSYKSPAPPTPLSNLSNNYENMHQKPVQTAAINSHGTPTNVKHQDPNTRQPLYSDSDGNKPQYEKRPSTKAQPRPGNAPLQKRRGRIQSNQETGFNAQNHGTNANTKLSAFDSAPRNTAASMTALNMIDSSPGPSGHQSNLYRSTSVPEIKQQVNMAQNGNLHRPGSAVMLVQGGQTNLRRSASLASLVASNPNLARTASTYALYELQIEKGVTPRDHQQTFVLSLIACFILPPVSFLIGGLCVYFTVLNKPVWKIDMMRAIQMNTRIFWSSIGFIIVSVLLWVMIIISAILSTS